MNSIEDYDREEEKYLTDLIEQVQGMDNPPPRLTVPLRQALESRPELYRKVFDLARSTQETLIQNIGQGRYQQDALTAQVEVMQRGMGYDQAPMLVKGLIENVCSCWLRLQWVEAHQAEAMTERYDIPDALFWERRHNAAQRRYLQACETLARVAKITAPVMQVNIAQDGGQQINVAGDLRRGI